MFLKFLVIKDVVGHKAAVPFSTFHQTFCIGVKLFTPSSSFGSSASSSGSWLQTSNCSDSSLWHLCVLWTLFSCLCYFLSSSCFSLRSSPPILHRFKEPLVFIISYLINCIFRPKYTRLVQCLWIFIQLPGWPSNFWNFSEVWSWHPPKSSSFFQLLLPWTLDQHPGHAKQSFNWG